MAKIHLPVELDQEHRDSQQWKILIDSIGRVLADVLFGKNIMIVLFGMIGGLILILFLFNYGRL